MGNMERIHAAVQAATADHLGWRFELGDKARFSAASNNLAAYNAARRAAFLLRGIGRKAWEEYLSLHGKREVFCVVGA